MQYSTALRDNQQNQIESTVGTAAKLQLRTGAPPADCAAADTGTLLAELTLPSDWLTASSSGQVAKNGTWTGTGAATGTPRHFRIKNNAGSTTHIQGSVFPQAQIATNALTAANSNVLNFASTTGVQVGMSVSGTGVPAGATVLAVTATTVTLSHASTAGVANATTITFGGEITMGDIANLAAVTVNSATFDRGNA